MNKNIFIKTVASAILFVSSSAFAGADYPAADFQPKVLYSDESALQSSKSTASVAKPAAVVVENDPNYPATNFQPKVVYADATYKHNSAAPALKDSARFSSSSSVESSEAAVVGSDKGGSESSSSTFIGVMVLGAVALFFIYNKKRDAVAVSSGSLADAAASGATGVEKYLDKMGANKTGVAKYLEKQGANTTTGVAKYMAKQIVRDREAAAARATGVEKYLRDKV